MNYSFQLAARVLLYAPSHWQDCIYQSWSTGWNMKIMLWIAGWNKLVEYWLVQENAQCTAFAHLLWIAGWNGKYIHGVLHVACLYLTATSIFNWHGAGRGFFDEWTASCQHPVCILSVSFRQRGRMGRKYKPHESRWSGIWPTGWEMGETFYIQWGNELQLN